MITLKAPVIIDTMISCCHKGLLLTAITSLLVEEGCCGYVRGGIAGGEVGEFDAVVSKAGLLGIFYIHIIMNCYRVNCI